MIRRLGLLLLLGVTLSAQQTDPDHPFPNHELPPAGWQCQHQTPQFTIDREHVCDCHRECYWDESTPPVLRRQEDAQCKTYCHPQNCSCAFVCEEEEAPKR